MASGGLEFLEWIRNARLSRSGLAAQHGPVRVNDGLQLSARYRRVGYCRF